MSSVRSIPLGNAGGAGADGATRERSVALRDGPNRGALVAAKTPTMILARRLEHIERAHDLPRGTFLDILV